MIKKVKDIILQMNRTRVEFKSVDGWIFDLRYLVNGRETYSAQILKMDIESRIAFLKRQGFTEEKIKPLDTRLAPRHRVRPVHCPCAKGAFIDDKNY